MKTLAIAAALAASIAAPVAAQSAASSFAIQHFNLSQDTAAERLNIRGNNSAVTISSRGGSLGAQTATILNRDADTVSDLRGVNRATVLSRTPAHGADIFARLRAQSLEDE